MRNTLIIISFCSIVLNAGCSMPEAKNEKLVDNPLPEPKDPFHQLCQYWEVTDAERPTYREVFDNRLEGVDNYPGIVFMTDSTFLENPRADMRYGKFTFKGRRIDAEFDDGQKATYLIQEKQGGAMIVKRLEKDQSSILYLKASNVFWNDATRNPYAKINSAWRVRPAKPESPQQLRERLKQCVRFYEYFFEGNSKSESGEIDFLGLPTCFKWYQGGIFVQRPRHLDKKWIDCFCSDEQALQARQIMEDAISKKYVWDTTEANWVKQLVPVLKQLRDQL